MNKQKQRSKQSSASKTYDWVILEEKPENFVGYDLTENEVKLPVTERLKIKTESFIRLYWTKLLSMQKEVVRLEIKES